MKHHRPELQEKLSVYLRDTVGLTPLWHVGKAKYAAAIDLAFYLEEGELLGRRLVFCFPKSGLQAAPAELAERSELVKASSGLDPVFVFETIDSWDRSRLVERRVSFVVPGSQLFMPYLFVDLRERFPVKRSALTEMPWTAQFLTLFHL